MCKSGRLHALSESPSVHPHDPQGQAPLHPQFPAPSARIPTLQSVTDKASAGFARMLHIESMRSPTAHREAETAKAHRG